MGYSFSKHQSRIARRFILTVLMLLLVVGINSFGEEKEYNSFEAILGEYRALVISCWLESANFSYEHRLFAFAREDDSHIHRASDSSRRRVYPDVPPPEGSMLNYSKWAEMRRKMKLTIAAKATHLLAVTSRLFPDYLEIAAKEVLIEDTTRVEARRILGQVYCSELGWVSGEVRVKVEAGLLPFKNNWLERDVVAAKRCIWENAWEMNSEHFKLRTTCDPEAGRQVLRFLEDLLGAFRRDFANALVCPLEMFSVNLFRDTDVYETVVSKYISGSMPSAFYCPKTDETYFDARIGPNRWLFDPVSVAHETIHQFTHALCAKDGRISADKPGAWVCEGVANYCEVLSYFEDRIVFTGFDKPVFLEILRKSFPNSSCTISDLVALKVQDFCSGQTSMVNRCHAEQLTSYLLNASNGLYRPGLYRYLRSVMEGHGGASVFRDCFDVNPQDMDAPFNQWMAERWTRLNENEYNKRSATSEDSYDTHSIESH